MVNGNKISGITVLKNGCVQIFKSVRINLFFVNRKILEDWNISMAQIENEDEQDWAWEIDWWHQNE